MNEPIHLGKQTVAAASPEDAVLDCVPNTANRHYIARFTCPEFTSMCPVTGQPDFATIIIDYWPDKLLVESKALKLFLHSFRNHGAYHESCTMLIVDRFTEAANPPWLRVCAFWYPRGGIPIDVFYQSDIPSDMPTGMYIPPVDISMYRPRH